MGKPRKPCQRFIADFELEAIQGPEGRFADVSIGGFAPVELDVDQARAMASWLTRFAAWAESEQRP